MMPFSIDFRSLRLYRFGLGAFLFIDILLRLPDFQALHTEAGAFPLESLYEMFDKARNLHSLYFLSESTWWAGTLFALTALTGILLMANVLPRMLSVIAFILAISLNNRNFMLAYGGDDLFRLALIWSALMPSGPRAPGEKSFSNTASMALFVQIFALYFCAGMNKLSEYWLHDPRGAFLSLSGGTFARPSAAYLLQWPKLLEYSSIMVFFTERFGWILFFSPWKPGFTRTLGVAIFTGMHLGFSFFLHLELFPLIDIILVTALLPTEFWDKLGVASVHKEIRPPFTDRFVAPAALGLSVVLAYVNISYIPQLNLGPIRPVRRLVASLSMDHGWAMFSNLDTMADGYHRIIGRTVDGQTVDLIKGQVIHEMPFRPLDIQKEQGGFRWTRFLDEASMGNKPDLIRKNTIEFFCKRWKPENPESKKGMKVDWYYFSERTVLAPGMRPLQESSTLYSKVCGE